MDMEKPIGVQDRAREAWMMSASAVLWLTRTTLSFCLYGQSPEPMFSGLQPSKAHTTHEHTHTFLYIDDKMEVL